MKKIFLSSLLVIALLQALAQGGNAGGFSRSDSILMEQIRRETNPSAIRQQMINLILLSDDKAPLELMDEAKQVDALGEKKKDAYLKTFAMSMFGQAYRLTGNFTKALQYHYKAIEMAKGLKDNSLIGYALNQSAHIFKDRDDHRQSIDVYKESIEYSKKGDVKVFQFYPYMNLGFVYMNAGMADSALYYSDTAEAMLKDIMDHETPERRDIMERSLYVYTLSNMGGGYSLKNDKANADLYYGKAMKIVDRYKGSQTRYFQFLYFNLAKHYKRFNITDSALLSAKEAIKTVAGTPVGYLASGPAKMLSDYYEKTDADSAVKYLKIYLEGNEVMNSTRVTQQLQMMAVEEEQKQEDIELAAKQYQQRIILYSLLAGLLSVIIFAFYMLRANRIRQRINKELSEQKSQLEQTLGELKATQQQLIQSEKMASLGELTAGIAHEIQNPLNFVNNFSEINAELTDEISEALDKDDQQTARALVNDIRENQQRINEHGKRAEAIVRGMLQHSRTGTGNSEPTDINALADEYLRLAFHGFRAKDKSFNAHFITAFDPSIGNVNIVPQDIGRVLLNLVNNAFYAVNEKAKSSQGTYEPTVTIKTQKKGQQVEISVHDNGNGIPEHIQQKIFQPFFTTKPTGQGTGLGLSLSYDIVKAHGGDLKLESKEGEGSRFTIQLPDRI